VTISFVPTTILIVTTTITIVTVTSKIVTSTILVCCGYIKKTFCWGNKVIFFREVLAYWTYSRQQNSPLEVPENLVVDCTAQKALDEQFQQECRVGQRKNSRSIVRVSWGAYRSIVTHAFIIYPRDWGTSEERCFCGRRPLKRTRSRSPMGPALWTIPYGISALWARSDPCENEYRVHWTALWYHVSIGPSAFCRGSLQDETPLKKDTRMCCTQDGVRQTYSSCFQEKGHVPSRFSCLEYHPRLWPI